MGIGDLLIFHRPKRKVVQSLQDNCISPCLPYNFTNCSRKLASLRSGKFYHYGVLARLK